MFIFKYFLTSVSVQAELGGSAGWENFVKAVRD